MNMIIGCRFGDRLAAIRLASSQEQTEAAQREVQELTTAKHLQGLCIPELLGYGFLQDGAYFVATSFLEVRACRYMMAFLVYKWIKASI